MTAVELADLTGKSALLRTAEGLNVAVRITDAREVFGRVDVLVTPASGNGQAWVSKDRISTEGGTK